MWQYDSPGKKETFSIENMTAEAWPEVSRIYMAGIWRDTVLLERRSDQVGVE